MLHGNTHYYLNDVRPFKKSLEVIFSIEWSEVTSPIYLHMATD